MKGVNAFLSDPIPQFDCLVVTARRNESSVGREPGLAHPVSVTVQTKLKPLSMNCPQLPEDTMKNKLHGEVNIHAGGMHFVTMQAIVETLIDLSSDDEIMDCPSFENSTCLTEPVCALNTVDSPLLEDQH